MKVIFGILTPPIEIIMTYAVLTQDDIVGMIPVIGLLLFKAVAFYKFLAFVWKSLSSLYVRANKPKPQEHDNQHLNSTPHVGGPTTNNLEYHLPSIVFLLLLSYLLEPLSTMFHLRGYRISNPRDHGLHDLVHGVDPALQDVLAKTPSLMRGPRPPILFHNRHLQFIPWLIQNELHRVEGIPFQRLELEVSACVDKTHGTDHCERSPLMTDTVTLDVFPPFDDGNSNTSLYEGFHAGSPIVLFSPGLRCYSQDMPGNMIIRRLYGEGFRSVVVNRRGHTPGQKLKAPRWNLFGDVDDLEQVYWHVQQEWAAPHTAFFLHGISSGTSVVVSALAEYDRRQLALEQQAEQSSLSLLSSMSSENGTTIPLHLATIMPRKAPSFVASISITPGYDISKVFLPERFKYPYNPLLLDGVKAHFIRDNEKVLRAFDSEAVDAALAASNLQELLDASAVFAGYSNATDYYVGENPVNWMHLVTTPTLVLNAIDDPCCHVHNIYEESPYPQHQGKSYARLIDESLHSILAVTKSGTHCPFLDSSPSTFSLLPAFIRDPLYGGWMLDSWADRVSVEFYKAALEVYEDRRFIQ